MNAANNSSSPLGKLIPVLVLFFGLIILYYIYQYLYGPKSVRSYPLISKSRSASMDPTSPGIVISSDKLPAIYEGGEFTISTWLYLTNWSYRAGFSKSIISIGGPSFDTIRVYLGGQKPNVRVRLQTKDMSGANNTVPTGVAPPAPSSSSQVPIESLDKGTLNATFNIMETDSGLLDSSPLCDLPEIDLQRWVNLTIAVSGKTVDVYLDGKLARSCVLPSFYKVDAGGYSATLLAYGGFGGQISTTTVYDSALNPEQVYKNYMAGPEPISSITGWLDSMFGSGTDVRPTA
jgi:hypothetical protein